MFTPAINTVFRQCIDRNVGIGEFLQKTSIKSLWTYPSEIVFTREAEVMYFLRLSQKLKRY